MVDELLCTYRLYPLTHMKEPEAMDPEVTIRTMRRIADRAIESETPISPQLEEMSGLFLALDEWLTRGGFLPEQWSRNR